MCSLIFSKYLKGHVIYLLCAHAHKHIYIPARAVGGVQLGDDEAVVRHLERGAALVLEGEEG